MPKTVIKSVREILEISQAAEETQKKAGRKLTPAELNEEIARVEKQMREAAKMLEFEYAAVLRDRLTELRAQVK